MREVAHRMVKFWVEAAKDEGLIDEEEGKIVYDELVYMLLAQMWAPNSPQWFNTGLKLTYGIDVPSDGNFYYDPEQKKAVSVERSVHKNIWFSMFYYQYKGFLVRI